ncbi:hypothetical protein LTR56_026266 [Elasticomyces elasticus]|nr:hypothetical protein LTR56_026266 [Elasticomyces elasticus]KAK3669110.1 hypothetical protein LTR22_000189 [Elasticomyces elasticus]KAK4920991.1 hypothetical protein LTR49_011535 [Elasticomyces elasticus]KAK5759504.1 hypothetical protein LTS12_010362 [Elasticomyces elasticus]
MEGYNRRGSGAVSPAAIEHFRSHSPSGSERRKLSYHPTGEWEAPATNQDVPAGAFQVSKTKRILQVAVAVVYCLLAAGIVFGYAAIKPVLVEEGVYRDKCTQDELDEGVWVCYEQELRLNLMFTTAAVSTNVAALPIGTVLDRYGPRIASMVGCVFLTIGALFFAFAENIPFDAYIPAYLFLALGGPFVFISSFQLSNTFPQHSGLILALLTGAFDTSSAIFLMYRLIYQKTNGWFTPKKFFLLYLIVPAFILVVQLFIMPKDSYKTVGELVKAVESDDQAAEDEIEDEEQRTRRREHRESAASEVTTLLGAKGADKQQAAEEAKAEKSGVWGALHGQTALQQIKSPWFVLITLFTVVQMLRINYFVATVRTQATELLHSHSKAVQVNEFFDVALPLGGVISVPFIGLVLDHTSTPFVLGLLVAIATTIGILGVIPNAMWAAYANIILFVLYRPFYYTAVSDYSAKVFGFATFGKVYGLIICLAGLLNFIQQGLDALTHKTFHNDPIPVNIMLLSVAFVVGVVLVGFVMRKSYTMHRDKLVEEAEDAREVLMPDAPAEEVNREHGHQTYGTA